MDFRHVNRRFLRRRKPPQFRVLLDIHPAVQQTDKNGDVEDDKTEGGNAVDLVSNSLVKTMKCPYCSVTINLPVNKSCQWRDDEEEVIGGGSRVDCGNCPACEKLIISLAHGTFEVDGVESYFIYKSSQIIYPRFASRSVEIEVPDRYKQDFLESCAVLEISPKASAALSRRILQDIFHEELGIEKANLAKEIEEFINRSDVPSYLSKAVDAVRNIGNFAAHPIKNTSTGEIVEVEPGEAEWLLEVNESMFDFVFIQPKRLDGRKEILNSKLKEMGKPYLKG